MRISHVLASIRLEQKELLDGGNLTVLEVIGGIDMIFLFLKGGGSNHETTRHKQVHQRFSEDLPGVFHSPAMGREYTVRGLLMSPVAVPRPLHRAPLPTPCSISSFLGYLVRSLLTHSRRGWYR